jgi:hypothetical protein
MLGFLVSRRENKDDILSQLRSRSVKLRVTKLPFLPKAICSVPDPDPHLFGLPSGSISQRYESGSGFGSFYQQAKIVRKTLIPTVL